MQNGLTRLLLVFLMLALPVQAFASVAFRGCECAFCGSRAPMALDHAREECHEAAAEKPGVPTGEHSCSHCAACCLASAIPIPVGAVTQVVPIPSTPHLYQAEPFSGFIPEGPERPPRTSSV